MCSCISKHFVSLRIWIARKDFPTITRLIKNEFPKEIEELYYKPPNEKTTNPGGMFYNKYNKMVNAAEKHKLLSRKNRKRKSDTVTDDTGNIFILNNSYKKEYIL